jgi:hypothetical protein
MPIDIVFFGGVRAYFPICPGAGRYRFCKSLQKLENTFLDALLLSVLLNAYCFVHFIVGFVADWK